MIFTLVCLSFCRMKISSSSQPCRPFFTQPPPPPPPPPPNNFDLACRVLRKRILGPVEFSALLNLPQMPFTGDVSDSNAVRYRMAVPTTTTDDHHTPLHTHAGSTSSTWISTMLSGHWKQTGAHMGLSSYHISSYDVSSHCVTNVQGRAARAAEELHWHRQRRAGEDRRL